jgi:DNA-binding MarR family transcriptional regulator
MATRPVQDSENLHPYRLLHDVYVLLDYGDRLVLDTHHLTPTQYRLLHLIDPKEGRRLTTLSTRLLMSKSQVTRTVDILEKAGLVARSGDGADGRAQLIVLTKAGVKLRDQVHQQHLKSLDARFHVLDGHEQELLAGLLGKLQRGMAHHLELD